MFFDEALRTIRINSEANPGIVLGMTRSDPKTETVTHLIWTPQGLYLWDGNPVDADGDFGMDSVALEAKDWRVESVEGVNEQW